MRLSRQQDSKSAKKEKRGLFSRESKKIVEEPEQPDTPIVEESAEEVDSVTPGTGGEDIAADSPTLQTPVGDTPTGDNEGEDPSAGDEPTGDTEDEIPGGAIMETELFPPGDAGLPEAERREETYVPTWKQDADEDDEDGPADPEGFEDRDEAEPVAKDSWFSRQRRRRKAKIVDDSEVAEEVYEEPEVKEKKQKASVKDIFFSLLETTIASAVFLLVGYQLGGVVIHRILENILGG